MAIHRFASFNIGDVVENSTQQPWAEGAYCPIGMSASKPKNRMVRWNEFQGLCLSGFERNGYDDSDFVMTIWDLENAKPFELVYATSRFCTYPSYDSKPDATPEIRALYREWIDHEEAKTERARRDYKANELIKARKIQAEVSKRYGFSVLRLRKMMRAEGPRGSNALALLKSKNLRKSFRINMREQLVNWLKDHSTAFPSPFSHKQWYYV